MVVTGTLVVWRWDLVPALLINDTYSIGGQRFEGCIGRPEGAPRVPQPRMLDRIYEFTPCRQTFAAPFRSRACCAEPTVVKAVHRLRAARPELRQRVLHARRDRRMSGSGHQPVAFKAAQRQGQHPLRDAAERAADSLKRLGPVAEMAHHEDRSICRRRGTAPRSPPRHSSGSCRVPGNMDVPSCRVSFGDLSSLGIKQ